MFIIADVMTTHRKTLLQETKNQRDFSSSSLTPRVITQNQTIYKQMHKLRCLDDKKIA